MASVGDVIAGKYRLEKVLEESSTGVTMLARHLVLDHTVSLHVLRSRVLDVDAMRDGTAYLVLSSWESPVAPPSEEAKPLPRFVGPLVTAAVAAGFVLAWLVMIK
jgi:hypothetical protein